MDAAMQPCIEMKVPNMPLLVIKRPKPEASDAIAMPFDGFEAFVIKFFQIHSQWVF